MGKPTGFLEYDRKVGGNREPKERLKDYKEFHQRLDLDEQCIQGARCMDCGVAVVGQLHLCPSPGA